MPSFPHAGNESASRATDRRTGYYVFRAAADTDGIVLHGDHHTIDEYLSEAWVDAWIADVLADVEDYLAKHAAFDSFLDEGEPV